VYEFTDIATSFVAGPDTDRNNDCGNDPDTVPDNESNRRSALNGGVNRHVIASKWSVSSS
jgi:hypothetical protein